MNEYVKIDNNEGKKIIYTVVGPICETGDVMGVLDSSRIMTPEDYIIIRDVGAYGAVMSSNYNSRPSISEVLVRDNVFNIIKKKISTEELLSYENIPSK